MNLLHSDQADRGFVNMCGKVAPQRGLSEEFEDSLCVPFHSLITPVGTPNLTCLMRIVF